VKAFIDRLIGEDDGATDVAAALEAAEQAFEAHDLQTAAELYAAVLQEDNQNTTALAGLARCYLKSGDIDRAEQTIALVPPDKRETAAVAGVRAAIDLARKGATQDGDTSDLERQIATDPANHQARLDLALAMAARGDKQRAIDELLEIFRRDRNWNDQAARKQLVQLFEAWGPKDEFTLEGRRRLSSLMFA